MLFINNPISIHAPCTGSDAQRATQFLPAVLFQSTLPARGATGCRAQNGRRHAISIHAPCTGSDHAGLGRRRRSGHFNPRSLHGERPIRPESCLYDIVFQSTLPARGATYLSLKTIDLTGDFNPRSLHGERRSKSALLSTSSDFNPRSLHGERHSDSHCRRAGGDFNPRSLHGERHSTNYSSRQAISISIHAPCTGSDFQGSTCRYWFRHFNPRSLHGERRPIYIFICSCPLFQSTLPARGATQGRWGGSP